MNLKGILFLTIIFLGELNHLRSQATFFKEYVGAGEPYHVTSPQGFIKTLDNGFIIGGNKQNDLGAILKFDSLYNLQWSTYVNTADYPTYYDIIQFGDSSYIAAGFEYDGLNRAVLMTKISSEGNVIWNNKLGGSNNYLCDKLLKISELNFYSIGLGNGKFSVTYLDSSGTIIWNKNYSGTSSSSNPVDYDVRMNDNNELIIVGTYPYNSRNIMVFKLDTLGNVIWSYQYGDEAQETGILIQNTYDDKILIIGKKFDGPESNLILMMLNQEGTVEWTKIIEAEGEMDPMSIIETRDSNYIITGRNNQSSWNSCIMKVDIDGNLLWFKNYDFGNPENCTNIIEMPDSTLLITGMTEYIFPTTDSNKYLALLTKGGNLGCFNVEYDIDSIYMLPMQREDIHSTIASNLNSTPFPFTILPLTFPIDSGCNCNDLPTIKINVKRCLQNDEYIFETNIDNPADYIFNWTLSDGQNSNDTLFNAIIQEIYLDTISLYLSIMDTTGCVSTSAYYMLDDSLVPDTIFSHIISNSTVDFMYQNSNNYSLFWDFGDGFTDSTNNPQHIYTINGEYQACLSIFSSCDTITICDSIEINILGVPTNRLINPVEILIVPNPFNEIFQIKFHNPIDTEYSIELLNFLGEVVLKEKHSDKLILDINGEKLLNGIYFLHILNAENQPVLTKKIIKIR